MTISTPWLQIAVTCTASALGSLMICADVVYNFVSGQNFSILDSNIFLGVALSLSSGTLLLTSMNALLPRAVEYISWGAPELSLKHVNLVSLLVFISGGMLCHIFNLVVVRFTSDSIVSCPHDLEVGTRKSRNHSHSLACEHSHLLGTDVLSHVGQDHGSEESYGGTAASSSAASSSARDENYNTIPGETIEQHQHHQHPHDPRSILSIGLQTTVGIAIHRVPEGLLLFATSQTDSQLGLSLVLALSFHSFSEGFSIAAPLYKALGSRVKVLAIALVLGCGPQVLGAYIGSLIFKGGDDLTDRAKLDFGVCMAATSGFMLLLALQMLSVAVRYMSPLATVNGVFAGCAISLFSRTL